MWWLTGLRHQFSVTVGMNETRWSRPVESWTDRLSPWGETHSFDLRFTVKQFHVNKFGVETNRWSSLVWCFGESSCCSSSHRGFTDPLSAPGVKHLFRLLSPRGRQFFDFYTHKWRFSFPVYRHVCCCFWDGTSDCWPSLGQCGSADVTQITWNIWPQFSVMIPVWRINHQRLIVRNSCRSVSSTN